jgi:hypothetical protein
MRAKHVIAFAAGSAARNAAHTWDTGLQAGMLLGTGEGCMVAIGRARASLRVAVLMASAAMRTFPPTPRSSARATKGEVARRRLGGFLALLPPKPDVASEDPLRVCRIALEQRASSSWWGFRWADGKQWGSVHSDDRGMQFSITTAESRDLWKLSIRFLKFTTVFYLCDGIS